MSITVRIHRVSIVQVSIRFSFIIRIVRHLRWTFLGNFVLVILLRRLVGVEGGAAGGGGVGTRVYCCGSIRCPLGGEGAEEFNACSNQTCEDGIVNLCVVICCLSLFSITGRCAVRRGFFARGLNQRRRRFRVRTVQVDPRRRAWIGRFAIRAGRRRRPLAKSATNHRAD